MLDFKRNFFFVKFVVLFFLMTLFGYWGIDLNSEEIYIAFSFFFLVVLAFVMLRLGVLSFFAGLVNSRYEHIVREGILVAYIASWVGMFWQSPLAIISFISKNYSFFVFTTASYMALRANVLSSFSLTSFAFLKLILGIAANFFSVAVLRVCKNFVFSFSLSKMFVVEV